MHGLYAEILKNRLEEKTEEKKLVSGSQLDFRKEKQSMIFESFDKGKKEKAVKKGRCI